MEKLNVATVKLSITLPLDMAEALRQKKAETGVPVSQQVARLLRPVLEREYGLESGGDVDTA
jgi:hypothetical protein